MDCRCRQCELLVRHHFYRYFQQLLCGAGIEIGPVGFQPSELFEITVAAEREVPAVNLSLKK